ncbi:MAG: DUF615 domain-containing protein [Endozoicomonadaceae bacterium]|nr:DUF615 domain-containing protein [Endozoicomonadaceae bacterium]
MNHLESIGEHENLDDDDIVSKSQIKREMHELREMGVRLQTLKPSHLEKLPLNEQLRAALEEGRRIKSFNAQKRHLNFVGKLMRVQDVKPIREYLQRLDSQTEASAHHFHQLERWRKQLLTEGNTALTKYLSEHPQADHQHIRQLVRNTLKEQKENKPPSQNRKLFRYLREVSETLKPTEQ